MLIPFIHFHYFLGRVGSGKSQQYHNHTRGCGINKSSVNKIMARLPKIQLLSFGDQWSPKLTNGGSPHYKQIWNTSTAARNSSIAILQTMMLMDNDNIWAMVKMTNWSLQITGPQVSHVWLRVWSSTVHKAQLVRSNNTANAVNASTAVYCT